MGTQQVEYFAAIPESNIDAIIDYSGQRNDGREFNVGDYWLNLVNLTGFTQSVRTIDFGPFRPQWRLIETDRIYPDVSPDDLLILREHYQLMTTIDDYQGIGADIEASQAMLRAFELRLYDHYAIWTTGKGATEAMLVGVKIVQDSQGRPENEFHPIVRWGRQFKPMTQLRYEWESNRTPRQAATVLSALYGAVLGCATFVLVCILGNSTPWDYSVLPYYVALFATLGLLGGIVVSGVHSRRRQQRVTEWQQRQLDGAWTHSGA